MKQLPRRIPLIRPKLPGLARRHHTHHPLPRVRPKLGQRLDGVHDEIGEPGDCFLPAVVYRRAFAVDGDEVVGLRLPSAVAQASWEVRSCIIFGFLDEKRKGRKRCGRRTRSLRGNV